MIYMHKKNSLLILPALLVTFMTNSMEIIPSSKNNEKKLPAINAEIYLNQPNHNGRCSFTMYSYAHFAPEWERKMITQTGLEVSPNDPCMPVMVITNDINWSNQNIDIINHDGTIQSCKKFPRSIPAKHLWNLTTGSLLELTIHGHPTKMICKKNPLINNKEFHEQFEERMEELYKNPSSGIADNPKNELIPNKILIKTIDPNHIGRNEYIYGENGCPNEKTLVKTIINEKTVKHNIFNSLMNRQITGSFVNKRTMHQAHDTRQTNDDTITTEESLPWMCNIQ